MVRQYRRNLRRVAAVGFVLLSVLYSGCLGVDTRHTYGAYYEHDGMWCSNFGMSFEGARVATLSALADLKMPIYREGPEHHGIFIDTRTPDNFEARVVILPLGRHADGARIGVRVGGFGTHRKVCERLLEAIAQHRDAVRHIYAMPALPAAPPPGATPASSPLTPAPPPQQSSSEPLLPPQPVPVDRK